MAVIIRIVLAAVIASFSLLAPTGPVMAHEAEPVISHEITLQHAPVQHLCHGAASHGCETPGLVWTAPNATSAGAVQAMPQPAPAGLGHLIRRRPPSPPPKPA